MPYETGKKKTSRKDVLLMTAVISGRIKDKMQTRDDIYLRIRLGY